MERNVLVYRAGTYQVCYGNHTLTNKFTGMRPTFSPMWLYGQLIKPGDKATKKQTNNNKKK